MTCDAWKWISHEVVSQSLMNAFVSLDTRAAHGRAAWPWVHRTTGSPEGSETTAPVLHHTEQMQMLCTWKKPPPERFTVSFWDKGPSEAHAGELHLSTCFCERSPKQSSYWWCKAISFPLSSAGGLSLTLLEVKSNAEFCQPWLLDNCWTILQQLWSTRPPPSAWIFFNFLHSFSDNLSFACEAFSA